VGKPPRRTTDAERRIRRQRLVFCELHRFKATTRRDTLNAAR
jgi:hypothetical protein